jgi:hypothetical protein
MRPVTKTDPAWAMNRERIEARTPLHPRGVVELLRRAGHEVVVREATRNAGFSYRLNGERWRTAFELTNRPRKLGIFSLAALFLLGAADGRAQTPSLVLACDGKWNNMPIEKIGVVVNLSAGTVAFDWMVARITRLTDSNVEFSGTTTGHASNGNIDVFIEGNIDRVTGVVIAWTTTKGTALQPYELQCKPTRRMF